MKVYCNNCEYCGDVIKYYPHEPYDMDWTIPNRTCNHPKNKEYETCDSWYMERRLLPTSDCHILNANNDCEYFKEKNR